MKENESTTETKDLFPFYGNIKQKTFDRYEFDVSERPQHTKRDNS